MTTRRSIRCARTIAVLSALMLSALRAAPAMAQGQTAFVLTTDNSVITIDTANPGPALDPVAVTGVTVGETLVGIDVRPQNGMLYGLGVNAAADTMTLYLISPRTGLAAPIGTGGFTGAGNLPDPAGARYGFDFNPAADRLRVITNQSGAGPAFPGLNFRLNPNTGGLTQADADINPAPISIDGAAYTNNRQATTVTTLYTISSAQDALYIQNPPNNGTQAAPIALSQDLTAVHGFDIDATVSAGVSNGPVAAGSAFAVVTTAGGTGLVQINLVTGAVSALAAVPGGAASIRGLAVYPSVAPDSVPATLLTADGLNLVRFQTATPGTTSTVAINPAGIVAGDVLVGIDHRPQTGQLYGLGFNAANNTTRLYLLDPGGPAAAATAIGAPVALTLPGATAFGFDFNPAADRIRVVTSAGENFRLHPITGALAGADTTINPAGAVITAAAYTNSFGQPIVAGAPTTLYTLDATNNSLAIQNTPNGGTQTLSAVVTLGGSPLDFTSFNGFDIPPAVAVATPNAAAVGRSYALLTVGGSLGLYAIELSTAVATSVGPVGSVSAATGLALGDGAPLPTATALSSSANPTVIDALVTFTATISPAAATGTVAFSINGAPIPACTAQPIAAGVATCAIAFAAPGMPSIVAAYSGDAAFRASASAPLSQTVNPIATTTTLTIDPNPAGPGEAVTFTATVTPASATGTVTFLVDGVPFGTAPLSSGQAVFTTSSLTAGSHTVSATYEGAPTFAPSSTTSPVTVAVGFYTQHFAEGATGAFFQTDVGILNTSATMAADVTVRLFPEGASPIVLTFDLNPLTRRTIDLNAVLSENGLAGGVSTLIESTQPIAATRQMTWGDPTYGSTLESGIPETSLTWSFAEGATNVFSLYYLVENPGSTPANITLTHLLEGGAAPVVQNEVVPPQSRRTFYINEVAGLATAALSTVITSDVPIVAERAMYVSSASRFWEGGTAGRGATALSTTWSLAEGATGFFYTYLLLGNPNPDETTVTVRYQLPDGTTIEKSYPVAGQSRRTIDVSGEDPLLASATIGMTVSSTLPIVAERTMWWGLPFYEGSVSIGATATGTMWGIGEAAEDGPDSEATFVLVSNGAEASGSVRFTVVYDDGTQEEREYALLGNARLTVRIGGDFSNAPGRRFSVLVESLTAGVPITVEYARYQSTSGFLEGGGAALATRIQ